MIVYIYTYVHPHYIWDEYQKILYNVQLFAGHHQLCMTKACALFQYEYCLSRFGDFHYNDKMSRNRLIFIIGIQMRLDIFNCQVIIF